MDEEYERYRAEQASGYLSEVRDAKRHIDAMKAEVDRLRDTSAGLKGIDYSKELVSASPYVDAIPDAVERIQEIIERNTAYIMDYVRMLDECDAALHEMGGMHSEVLRYRYICDMRWEDISAKMSYSEQWLYDLHNQALCSFFDYMPAHGRDPVHRAI